jgi:hypothetical protein
VLLKILRHFEGVLGMFRRAQRERLDALDELPGGVRREGGALVAESDGAQAQDEGDGILGAEVVGEAQAVVAAVRLVEEREFRIRPVELAGVDDDATDAGTVSADPLGKRCVYVPPQRLEAETSSSPARKIFVTAK